MNLKQCVEISRAQGAKTKRLQALLTNLGEAGRWEVGVDSREPFKTLSLRCFSEKPPLALAARILGVDAPRGARAPLTFPRLSFDWDLAADKPGEILFWTAAAARAYQASPFSGTWRKDPALAAIFSDFHALCPISEIVTKGTEWSLRLKSPPPWSHFIRLNMADPFLKSASALAYLLLDRKVTELAFSAESLRVYVR